jgi:L-fuculose-phosphate aldolase
VTYGAFGGGAHVTTERALREEFVRIGQLMHTRNYVTSTDGNISARLDPDRFLVTPSGLSKGFMIPEQMVVIDWDAKRASGSRYGPARNLKPSSEILLHLEAYRQRPEIKAVVHAHPPTAIALSIAGISLARCLIPEVIVTLGLIPTTEYATPASAEGAVVIRDLITRHDAVLLQRHGSVTVGSSPFDAYLKLEKVENVAEITYKLLMLGRELPFPPGAVDKLIENRERHGLMLPGQREEMEQACGVCSLVGRCLLPKVGA